MANIRQPTTQEEYDYWKSQYDTAGGGRQMLGGFYSGIPGRSTSLIPAPGETAKDFAYKKKTELWNKLQEEKANAWAKDPSNPEVQAKQAWEEAQALTKGRSEQMLADPRIKAALARFQSGMEGPYTPAIQQQMINRMADQSAAAEAVNAEEIRNQAAARGLDPTQALRQGQAQRQQANLAFSGDIGTQAALQNYQAGQHAAQSLAGTRMAQLGQAQQGFNLAAQANLQRQFGGQRAPAVQSGVAPTMAFGGTTQAPQSSGSVIPTPQYMQPIAFAPSKLIGGSPAGAAATTGYKPPVQGAVSTVASGSGNKQAGADALSPQRQSLLNSLNAPTTKVYQPGDIYGQTISPKPYPGAFQY